LFYSSWLVFKVVKERRFFQISSLWGWKRKVVSGEPEARKPGGLKRKILPTDWNRKSVFSSREPGDREEVGMSRRGRCCPRIFTDFHGFMEEGLQWGRVKLFSYRVVSLSGKKSKIAVPAD